jgi:cellobiose phosphorylase
MLNPINRTRTDLEVNTYKVEPYVMAADVYTNAKHLGRGGWTWYTGAASWMYRFAIEYLLGFKKRENRIILEPLLKDSWDEFEIEYKYKNAVYKIKVMNNNKTGTSRMIEDGVLKEENSFDLVDDGGIHFIEYLV